MGQARQHQEQGEFGGPRSTQRGGQAQLIGELLEREEQAKDGAADGSGGKLIELAAEGAPEGLDADGAPAGQVGEGTFLTLPFWRKDSRSKTAGGELRLGTDSTYMGILYHKQHNE